MEPGLGVAKGKIPRRYYLVLTSFKQAVFSTDLG